MRLAQRSSNRGAGTAASNTAMGAFGARLTESQRVEQPVSTEREKLVKKYKKR